MNANDVKAETRKKLLESPLIPTVPGPIASAKTLTDENAPLMIPNPNPATYARDRRLRGVMTPSTPTSDTFCKPASAVLQMQERHMVNTDQHQ